MAFRFSTRPHKQFLWLLIRREAKLSDKKDVGLDAGCANMRNKRFFNTKTYIGLDPDNFLLKKGKNKYPDAKVLNSSILKAPSNLKADFVHCIQVLVNADFKQSESLAVTKKLISFVEHNGCLLMNTSRKTLKYDDRIEALLKHSFENVKVIKYGSLGIKQTSRMLSLFIAICMYCLPFLRTVNGHDKTFYRCVGKK